MFIVTTMRTLIQYARFYLCEHIANYVFKFDDRSDVLTGSLVYSKFSEISFTTAVNFFSKICVYVFLCECFSLQNMNNIFPEI